MGPWQGNFWRSGRSGRPVREGRGASSELLRALWNTGDGRGFRYRRVRVRVCPCAVLVVLLSVEGEGCFTELLSTAGCCRSDFFLFFFF